MKRSRIGIILGAAALGSILAVSTVAAGAFQTPADEALAKKYAQLLGRYDLDLTALGGDMHPTNVIVKDGRLWLDDGDGRPAEIKPVGDSGLEFEGQDDSGGALKVTFIKDETGAVAQMRLSMPGAGLEAMGKKIKSPIL